ncbi:ATP-binding cassette transporter protein YOR1-like protein [Lasiosphaeria miniovina]|uniref:ATP-binding cassette transporter protein YOR1-like protein n=1 Tax=Lasiosphaeria miniovina TaxID=1954250 RepID=A0AA40B472_9PEZI|nr:ATP-binding cassette transporter protein YOR1-like protein [Lasiosphaeria miniovina]KAK0727269.1 ATP-binding cassette transporter protein YOR1-like protein [Lasiosphaeria miniovina]
MAGTPPESKKETAVPNPAAAAATAQPSSDESLGGGKEAAHVGLEGDDKIERHPEDGKADDEADDKRAGLSRLKSYATATSVTSTTSNPQAKQKPWYQQPNPLRWGKIPQVPKERQVCPEHTAGFFSSLFFFWMGPLMQTGYKRPLELNDLYSINPDRAVDPLTEKMRESFKRRVVNGEKNPLLWAIHETFFKQFWIGGLCNLSSSILMVMSPYTLRYLIQFSTDAYIASGRGLPPPHIGEGLGLVFGVTAMQMLQSLGTNQFIYRGMLVGGMARASLISLIYEKSMVISGRAKAGGEDLISDSPSTIPGEKDTKEKKDSKEKKGKRDAAKPAPGVAGDGIGWGNGRVVNIMSVDTYRIDQAAGLFHIIWTAPIACIITLVMLLINLTYSALAGFALLAIGIPVLTNLIKGLFIRRKAINKITDQRVSLTQEILQSVRFVKFFGWESSFLNRLDEFRNREILGIQILLAIRNAIMAVSLSLPILASMLSFITFSLTHHDLAPAEVFSSLALFNGLRMPLNLLPMVIGQVTDAWSSLMRIQEFLLTEERSDEATFKPDTPSAVEMHNASFTWERTPTQEAEATVGGASKAKQSKSSTGASKNAKQSSSPADSGAEDASTLVEEREPFKLHDINFEIGRNELVAVIGTVGSGKTSLLSALAGDMRRTNGEVVLGASRAFCPQYAWIQNATLRDNILFGKEMDTEWYSEVIRACALQPDLDMLPNHDLTEIGERGITISGGQKQRLNIARAIYFDADIVLMDDPLSAVDAHVGRHIFDNGILGLLKDKCRILATHQLWVLSRCDRIIWMEAGKIQAIDTFDNLMKNSEGFQQLMDSTAVEEKKDKAEIATVPGDNGQTKKHKKSKGLMQLEERAVSNVPWSVYVSYVKASGSILNAPLVFFLLVISQGANIVTSLWLSYWTSDKFGFSMGTYIGVYAALGVTQALLMFAFMVCLSIVGTTASKSMLRRAITRVLRAPMSFFDTTPLGRITNRFSRDVDVMDNTLTDALRMYFFSIGGIISVFALIISFFHYFAIALVPLFVLFLFATSYYRHSAREVKRFESVLRSNVFAKFGEGLSGVACIRAYGLENRFIADLRRAIDQMDSTYYLTYSNQRWLSVRLDMIGNALVFTTGILVVTSRFSVSPSIGGLVLSYILSIVQMIQFTIRQLAEVENGMNAVERIQYYGNELDEEAPLKTIEVRQSWPEKGEIIFDDVQMRYRPGLPLVLQGLSIHIRGGERIGIVGRTGAGKSSIMSSLFRLVELSGGHITIDGLDISTIGLQDLRSRLAIIPQDPTLFRGTIRSNLDPFGEHTDLELWGALRQADLVPADGGPKPSPAGDPSSSDGDVVATRDPSRIHLDTIVEEEGLNFSLGQRQLMALARALVRGSQIIVCDEATSSIDMETDDKIQATIAHGFRGKTLLCIAHRLRTIIGYDRICVMDQGRIAEMATPLDLWKIPGGIFRGMCDRSGIRVEDIRGAKEKMGARDAKQDAEDVSEGQDEEGQPSEKKVE